MNEEVIDDKGNKVCKKCLLDYEHTFPCPDWLVHRVALNKRHTSYYEI